MGRDIHNKYSSIPVNSKATPPMGHLLYRLRMMRMKGRRLHEAEERIMMGALEIKEPHKLYEESPSRLRCFDKQGGALNIENCHMHSFHRTNGLGPSILVKE